MQIDGLGFRFIPKRARRSVPPADDDRNGYLDARTSAKIGSGFAAGTRLGKGIARHREFASLGGGLKGSAGGRQHGLRRATNLMRILDAFYSKVKSFINEVIAR
jgi:hypothetical protein